MNYLSDDAFRELYNDEDFIHVKKVRDISILLIGNNDEHVLTILQYCCMLHDVGKKIGKVTHDPRKHDIIGAEYFKADLRDQFKAELIKSGITEENIDKDLHCIYCAILFHSGITGSMEKYPDLWKTLDPDSKNMIVTTYVSDTIAKALKKKNLIFGKWIKKDIVTTIYKRLQTNFPNEWMDIQKRAIALFDIITDLN